MAGTLPELNGYQFLEQIFDGSRSQVYRACRESDEQAVIIKFLTEEFPSFHALNQFRHQYDLTRELDIEGVVSPLALESYLNKFALVMPDVQAVDLYQYLGGEALSVDEFLPLAIRLSQILGELHDQNIIHKDIKPHNILYHPTTHQLHLIDFSIASRLSVENKQAGNIQKLEGTLDYLSPEQTGRMNRTLDYRSDFYSLGVSLYEMLTGRLPFHSDDALEIVHFHIARTPTAPSDINPLIPEMLDQIVLKLMEKNAEDRYQSAQGLKKDLQKCLNEWRKNQHIPSFNLGMGDKAEHFQIPEKLYGRQDEVLQLLGAFEQTALGQVGLVLVTGLSGIGKTALVNEIHKPITRERGYFVSGKFDQFNRETPYSALSQALTELVEQILECDKEKQLYWRKKILKALGDQAQVMIELIPALSQLIGPQAAVKELYGEAAANRFHYLFQQFIRLFSTKKHPVVLFLDDIQWIDSASLKLMEYLLQSEPDQALLLIGAYRHNEVSEGHPLLLAIENFRQREFPITSLKLKALTKIDISQLLTETCHSLQEHIQPLTQAVMARTQGNPFFIHQFLHLLDDESLVRFNESEGYWDYEPQQIQQLVASNDVVEFMAQQLKKLPESSQNLLSLAACSGNTFSLVLLADVSEVDLPVLAEMLWPALNEQYIVPLDDTISWLHNPDNNSGGRMNSPLQRKNASLQIWHLNCRFAHDRVQQAAYSLMPEEQQSQTHLKIGRLLAKTLKNKTTDNDLFECVNQLNQALSLVTEQERRQLAQWNLDAGNKAKQSTAYHAASRYYHSALGLLAESSWDTDYDLTLSIHEGMMETSALQSHYDEQFECADVILQHSHCIYDEIKTHQYQCTSLVAQNKSLMAIQYALPYLKQLDIEFPEQPTMEDIQTEIKKTQAMLGERSVASLIDLPRMKNARALAGLNMLSKLNVAFYTATPMLFPLAVCKKVQLALSYGNTEEVIPYYAAYGFVLSALVDEIEQGYEYGQLAEALLNKMDAKAQTALTLVNLTGPKNFKEPLRNFIAPLLQGMQAGRGSGDLHYASVSGMWIGIYSLFAGMDLETLHNKGKQFNQFMLSLNQKVCFDWNELLRQMILNLLGQSEDSVLLKGDAFDETAQLSELHKVDNYTVIAMFYCYKLNLAYLFQQLDVAKQACDEAGNYLAGLTGTFFVPYYHFYSALTYLAYYEQASPEEQNHIVEQVDIHQGRLRFWADHCIENFEHKWTLIEAERCRVNGSLLEAEDYYDQAINGAHQYQFVQEEALANELAASFYLQRNRITIAEAYITKAYYAYSIWGAKAKVDDISQRYSHLLTPILKSSGDRSSQHNHSSTRTADTIDLNTLFRSTQALSSQLSLRMLLINLLKLVMENAGARRCVLLLNENEQWRVAAQSVLEDDQALDVDATELPNVLLSEFDALPRQMLSYVMQSHRTFALDDASSDNQRFQHDLYFQNNRTIKSVLCQPILSQDHLIGLIYLENDLTASVFHENRLKLIHMLATQAAISIENALLYENLEVKVRQRTQALKIAQSKLLEQARESGMAEIAIGVMHNIGNTMTPLKTRVEKTRQSINNSSMVKQMPRLMEFLDKALDSNSPAEQDKARHIISQLSPVVANEYEQLSDQLKEISQQLYKVEEFVHLQSKYTQVTPMKESVDINQLIKDVLTMLDERIQKNCIELTLLLQKVPDIKIEKYQLLQIISNLIKNACEAMEEVNIDKRLLGIQTSMISVNNNNLIELRIQDSGKGFLEEEKFKLFSPGYQNKLKSSSIGLHESANYLIAQDATIEALSDGAGKGATFVVQFPVGE